MELPAVLPAYDEAGRLRYGLDLIRCLAVPPADQTLDAGLEQGLRAGWEALSADSDLADQVCDRFDPSWSDDALTPAERRSRCGRAFLREGAALIVVFVSDEDDCSVAAGKRIAAEDFGHCAWLGDSENRCEVEKPAPGTDDRPLVSVPEAAAALRAVAPDPERLYVVAVTGDVLRPDTAQQAMIAQMDYLGAVLRADQPTAAICIGTGGRAARGGRYLLVADELGPSGFFVNICSATAFNTDLAAVGETIGADLARCAE